MLVVGGGGTSQYWRQMLADVFGIRIVKSNVDQDAAALGAAAIAAVGSGLWSDFDPVDQIHQVEDNSTPRIENTRAYERKVELFDVVARAQADFAAKLES
jgi:xylulokinase